MKKLVIVESPTKAKTISKFLGKEYTIKSSFGHVRDLPKTKLGVDTENNFEPTYVVPRRAKKAVDELKAAAKKSELVYFATDEDREGEAIAWHLLSLLKTEPKKIRRIAFHEVTKDAIEEALENPRDIDANLVDAQQARRVLDRLVGYKLSPLLWKKIAYGLSAGRVQSVAVRLVVEREREIEAFIPKEFWTVDAIFEKEKDAFEARLQKINGKTVEKFSITEGDEAKKITEILKNETFTIARIEKKQSKKQPPAPFTTSTLQQTANNRLGFTSKKTMFLAQQLYEGIDIGNGGPVGLITYMRTDATTLSNKFTTAAKEYIGNTLGEKYYGGERVYKSKTKNAQEAHEAIRPTDANIHPDDIASFLSKDQFRLYDVIWRRAMASQMANALIDQTNIDVTDSKNAYTFRANGSIIAFDGFMKIYPTQTKESILPNIQEKDEVDLKKLDPNQHFTEPPARYSEATLVKAMEERGIGRPSTYAPIISTIQERNYATKEGKALKPTEIGKIVNDLLVKNFPKVVDYDFTAKLEDELDDIANGEIEWQKVIKNFYSPFEKNIMEKEKELSKKDITEEKTNEVCEKCGKPMVVKIGKFGKFLACTGFPECKNTKELDENGKKEEPMKIEGKCPDCGRDLVQRRGRFGSFVGCSGYPDCKYIRKEPEKEFATCPKCNEGKIVTKRSKRGIFYACNKYPDCKTAYWSQPTGDRCPECKDLLLHGKNDTVVCGNKECGYKT